MSALRATFHFLNLMSISIKSGPACRQSFSDTPVFAFAEASKTGLIFVDTLDSLGDRIKPLIVLSEPYQRCSRSSGRGESKRPVT